MPVSRGPLLALDKVVSQKSFRFRQFLSVTFLVLAGLTQVLAQESREDKTPVGTTVQLPTFGVAIDADGVLTVKAYRASGRLLHAKMFAAARLSLEADVAASSELRKISLVRLEQALHRKLVAGEEPD